MEFEGVLILSRDGARGGAGVELSFERIPAGAHLEPPGVGPTFRDGGADETGFKKLDATGFIKQPGVIAGGGRIGGSVAEEAENRKAILAPDIHFAIGDGGNCKFDAVGHLIASASLSAVINLRRDIGGIV